MSKAKRNRRGVALRCVSVQGRRYFAAADELARERLGKKFKIGDEVSAELWVDRNPQFHRYVHQFCTLVGENIEAFSGFLTSTGRPDSHSILKRIQIEGNVCCDEIPLNFPGLGPTTYRQARSINFGDMEEDEFQSLFVSLTDYVRRRYWPDLEAHELEPMLEMLKVAA